MVIQKKKLIAKLMIFSDTINKDFIMKKIMLIVIGASSLLLSACNTFSGFGEDVQAGGHAITRSAEDTKSNM